jgi:hypothetical protein
VREALRNLLKDCPEVGGRTLKNFPEGLKRLQKKARVREKLREGIPQGLKPS